MAKFKLSKRWYPLRYHEIQNQLMLSKARFKVVPAGRRSGKTENAKRNLVEQGLLESTLGQFDDYRYFAAAPTRDQAKAIYWQDLKALTEGLRIGEPRETDLMITLLTGAEIWVLGMDKPQRIEGRPWNGGVLDEYADMKPGVWGANIRPALADRKGWCWLIGVPEGRNHYHDLYQRAISDTSGEWEGFTWKSADILDPEEIASARLDLDELTFKQEFEASFVNFEGRAYYPFEEATHCSKALKYDPTQPLIFTFDFNVAPGTAGVLQEQVLPSGLQGTGIIGEVYIPRNSNTPAVCRKLIADWGDHYGKVVCYGDATGGARGSAKVDGSDWDIIKRHMRAQYGERVFFRVPDANPPERTRLNAVNTRLLNMEKQVRLMVDPSKAPHIVKDFEGVTLLKGGSGELDKMDNPDLTHLSDGIGYYVNYEFPITGKKTFVKDF